MTTYADTAEQADNAVTLRIGSVRTDYGTAVIPEDARWTGGWSSSGLPVEYTDGRKDVVQFTPDPPRPRWEWYGTVT